MTINPDNSQTTEPAVVKFADGRTVTYADGQVTFSDGTWTPEEFRFAMRSLEHHWTNEYGWENQHG